MDLFGFRIGVDRSWFLILFLLIFLLSGEFRQALHSSDGVAYLTTVVTVLVLFASLIVHELGHALVARRQGITVRRIDLFLFGGLTEMSRDAATPGEDFKIAGAGPLATFGFVLLCLAVDLAIVGPHRLIHAAKLDTSVKITPVLLSLSWLLFWNVLLLLFNLVPAFPLDGGRMTRAIVWRLTGEKQRGTRVAAKLGQGFGLLVAATRRVAAARLSQLHRAVAARDRLPALPVGARGVGADRAQRPDRRGPGRGHHGPPAGRDPVADGGRAGARRVLPALRVVVVPGRRRQPPVPRDRPPGAPDRGPGSRRGLA